MFGYRKLHVVILARLWNLLSGLLLVFVSSNVFSAVEQGVMYTFLSLAAAQFFFDLGVGVVLANIAGRNASGNAEDSDYTSEELKYLNSITTFALKWSFVAGTILIAILGVIGWVLFADDQQVGANLQTIWLAYVVLVACSMSFHLFLRLFEGLGFVVEAAIARSVQSAANIAVIYLLAIYGMGIISMVVALLIALIAACIYFLASSSKIRSACRPSLAVKGIINWRKDVYPFQSKVAVSWLAGYVIFQSQVPILYSLAGPIQAGQLGIAVQIFQSLNTSANIFLTYNIKDWTRLSVNDDMQALNKSFMRTLALTLGITIVGCIAIVGGIFIIRHLGWQMAVRFPDLSLLILFAIAACFNQIFFCLGYYFRAQGREPLWWVSVIAAIAILIVPAILWQSFDITAAIWSFLFVSVVILSVLSSIYSLFFIKKDKRPTTSQEEI